MKRKRRYIEAPDNMMEKLTLAKTKPDWCSNIRWKMELKRRKMFGNEYYPNTVDELELPVHKKINNINDY